MVYVLYRTIESSHCRMVLICAAEMGLLNTPAFELRKVDWTALYAPDDQFDCVTSPFKRFPWFEDTETGVKLCESRAIAKYLAMKTNSSLLPDLSTPEDMAKFDSACSIEMGDFANPSNRLSWELLQKPMFVGQPPNKDIVDMCLTSLDTAFKGYERILSNQKYLAGNEMTIVDLFPVPIGVVNAQLGATPVLAEDVNPWPIAHPSSPHTRSDGTLPIPGSNAETDGTLPFPHLRAWWARLLALDSVKLVNKQFEDRMVEWEKSQLNTETKTDYDYLQTKL